MTGNSIKKGNGKGNGLYSLARVHKHSLTYEHMTYEHVRWSSYETIHNVEALIHIFANVLNFD